MSGWNGLKRPARLPVLKIAAQAVAGRKQSCYAKFGFTVNLF
jgi:hypothetical protein